MASEIITLEDLQDFKAELINDIRRIIKETSGQPTKKWLKSYEVREFLTFPRALCKISESTGLYLIQKSVG